MGEKKQLRVKNGTIVVEDRTADIKVKKNYSISQDAVDKLEEITKKLGNTTDRKSTRLNSSHMSESRMPSSA